MRRGCSGKNCTDVWGFKDEVVDGQRVKRIDRLGGLMTVAVNGATVGYHIVDECWKRFIADRKTATPHTSTPTW